MALIEQSDLEARLGRSLTAEEASAFTIVNTANQAYVEGMIGSSVESVAEATRYFDGGVQHPGQELAGDLGPLLRLDAPHGRGRPPLRRAAVDRRGSAESVYPPRLPARRGGTA